MFDILSIKGMHTRQTFVRGSAGGWLGWESTRNTPETEKGDDEDP